MKGFLSHFAKLKAAGLGAVMLGTALISPLSFKPQTAEAVEIDANFAKALQYSVYFYDANMCGTEAGENSRFAWRGACHTQDAALPLNSKYTNMSDSFIAANSSVLDPDKNGTVDVSGGFHDAGDHVKFGVPEAYSGSTLGWGYYEFRDAYVKTGQSDHIETVLRYFNDYFMKCTFRDASGKVVAFCYQVGDGTVDHAYWSAPELQNDMFRPGRFATSEDAATDSVSNSAASLAANYLNFKDTDPTYAAKCLEYAIALYDFAINTGSKDVCSDGGGGFYTSQKWEDDYCWGAAWLYISTHEQKYLDIVYKNLDYYAPSSWVHCWNDVWGGVMCLVGEIDDKENIVDAYVKASGRNPYESIDFWSQVAKTVDIWMTNYTTPGGYAFLNQWGSARYNTAAQLMALVYDKHHGGVSKYGTWAEGQMEYLMGDNPLNRCYIVGFNEYSVKYPHHRAASGLTMAEDPREQKHVLYGALVGGPDGNDQHNDTTADWIYNEVTIDYNAAFVGACAGLYTLFGNDTMKVTPDFPPAESEEDTEIRYWTEAFAVDDGKVTAVTFYVYGTAPIADKKISVRYYFDTTGMTSLDPNNIELRQYYDQVAAETDYAAVLSSPIKYDGNIYYIEVTWPDYAIANSNKKYQFAIGSYTTGNVWDPKDDWSHQSIATATDSFSGTPAETPYICVYSDGVLVGGIEPDGTKPSVIYTEANLLSLKKHVLNKTPLGASSTEKYDLDANGKMNSVDVLLLKRKLLS